MLVAHVTGKSRKYGWLALASFQPWRAPGPICQELLGLTRGRPTLFELPLGLDGGHRLDALPVCLKVGWDGQWGQARPAGGYAGSVRLHQPTMHRLEQQTKGAQ